MRRDKKRLVFLTLSFLTFVDFPTSGFAAEKTPFYQGKTLNFVINFAAGGPTDIEARMFAKHLSRHIPGNRRLPCKTWAEEGASSQSITLAK
jgi:tripartite-type tricarboxylate transporter receptor subunit TctC